ncbi:MAG: 4-hydroxythreonine-4-phosphate dehydrogenase PdxA [Bacteroidales bacterium]|nr:4-hydroxythreonine-4-phosphate dehydrogenase PdxA [Bacteroidales bacterium]
MNNTGDNRPVIAVTMGDPAGIGPEIAAKAFADHTVYGLCKPVLIGNSYAMEKAIDISSVNLMLNRISDISEAKFECGAADIFEIHGKGMNQVRFGEISAEAGDIAFRAVRLAIELAMKGKADATVTGPIHKESLNKAGHHFSGHTEIYARLTGTPKYAMLLADENIRIIHVTTHVSLRQACDLVKKEKVLDTIRLMHDELRKSGIASPRIGVAGLNPHAGDGGLFGNEETEEIIPAIEEAVKSGIHAEGPIPADTLFALARGGRFDGCVAMYHDQGHIPFKLLGFDWDQEAKMMKSVRGVNITVGLPIIRTSVDHGTAFEIAGRGIASPDAMLHAIRYAVKMVKNRLSE